MNFAETVLAVIVGIGAYNLGVTLYVRWSERPARPKSSGNRAGEVNWQRFVSDASKQEDSP